MIGGLLKVIAPRGLLARTTLIMLVPVATILLVVSLVVFQRLYDRTTRQMTDGVVPELILIVDRIEATSDPGAALGAALEIARPLGVDVAAAGGTERDKRNFGDISGRIVVETLRARVPNILAVDLATQSGRVRLVVETQHGPIALDLSRRRFSVRNPQQFLIVIGITAILMTFIGLLYLRNQVRPIRRLEIAAEAFGKGRVLPYRPSGATEVRAAGNAFLEMRNRI